MIPFNKPYLSGKETEYIKQAVESGKISGDGVFTKKCHSFFEEKYGFRKCLLTTSCTDALEMAAILLNIQPDDEVIIPSYTFVSTANAFVLRGAKVKFADSNPLNPNVDPDSIEKLITPKTKAIVPVHYAGIACEMNNILALANKYSLWVVEDAAQAIDSLYCGKPLGSFGHLAAFSFHETKNVISGEGGMLAIREKGTNRSAFFRGEIDKYGWVDIGSSYLPSEINAAFLFAQLEHLDQIQIQRISIWNKYWDRLYEPLSQHGIRFPYLIEGATNNAHMFYIVCRDLEQRTRLLKLLKNAGILAVFHYLSLHKSPYFKNQYDGSDLPWSDFYSDCLIRLPMFFELGEDAQEHIISTLIKGLED